MAKSAALTQINAHRQTLKLPHIHLSYLEWNQGQEPLLLLHGLADHSVVWASLAESLSQQYHIIAPDLRGHGDSSKPESGYGCDDIIADLEALMSHKGWTSAHIVAHSWSAKVAAIWARQQPQRFRSLVLVDPFFIGTLPAWMKITFPMLYQVLPFLKMMGPFSSYEQAQQQARQLKQYLGWSDFQEMVFHAAMEEKADGSWGSKFVSQARDEIFVDVMRVAGLTQDIEIPSLLILPEAGLNRSAWQIKPYLTYLKKLQVQKVPGNHWPFLVEPEAFNQAVADFLKSQC